MADEATLQACVDGMKRLSLVSETKLRAYLNDVGAEGVRQMLLKIGLLKLNAEGKLEEVEDIDGGGRCTDPLMPIQAKVSASLTKALEKQAGAIAAALEATEIKVGECCKRKNCKLTYKDESSNENECIHCPGEPVFHEGFKYWSCCESKKTLEFDEFLSFPGCTSSKGCQWHKDPDAALEQKSCRYDWYETDNDVVVSVFAKNCEPDSTVIQVNADTLDISTVYERTSNFLLTLHLAGAIVPERCTVSLMSAKIDIKLVKAEGGKWSKLNFEEE